MPPKTSAEVLAWLRNHIGMLLNVPADSIDPHCDLNALGLDSVSGVNMVGELEDWFGYQLEPAQLSGCVTLNDLAHAVSEARSRAGLCERAAPRSL
jgi:acyl carrier protein